MNVLLETAERERAKAYEQRIQLSEMWIAPDSRRAGRDVPEVALANACVFEHATPSGNHPIPALGTMVRAHLYFQRDHRWRVVFPNGLVSLMDVPFLWSYSALGAVAAALIWCAFRPPRSLRKFILHALVTVIVLLSALSILTYLEKPKWETYKAPCAVNLWQIQAAKAEWAREFKKTGAGMPQEADLFGANKHIHQPPICPDGGTYRLGAINEYPTCSLVGWQHELDRKRSYYQGSVIGQKAVFCLFGLGLLIVLRLVYEAWQVEGWLQKLRFGGLAAVLFVFISLGPPNFIQARVGNSKSACSAHLRSIQGAKESWAKELKKNPMDVPRLSDLVGPDKYLRFKPVCPLGGTFRLGAVREKPTCSFGNSYPGHTFEFNQ